jgi:hypothetical protein
MLVLFALLACGHAAAAPIAPTDVTPSTSLSSVGSFTLNQISDGDSASFPFNGFVSNARSGTISFALANGPWDMNSFTLWNDINIQREGIATFRLDFFDADGNLISSSGVLSAATPVSPVGGEIFNFPSPVLGVDSVDLVVLSVKELSAFRRIEIREVAFDGTQARENTAAYPVPVFNFWGLALVAFCIATVGSRSAPIKQNS